MMLQGSGLGQAMSSLGGEAGLKLQAAVGKGSLRPAIGPLLPQGSESRPEPVCSQLPQAFLIFIPGVVFCAERILFPHLHPPGGWMIK